MTAPAKRTRTSDRALRIALKAIQDAGLPVEKVLINGAQIEIQCAHIAEEQAQPKDRRLKAW
jgi:hypothetical protein